MSEHENVDQERLGALAQQINAASDAGDQVALEALAAKCDKAAVENEGVIRVVLRYFESNAHAGLADIVSRDVEESWSWTQPHLVAQVLALRKSIRDESFREAPFDLRCQIRTNLGNALNRIGRPIAAIDQWNEALALNPKFAMALGNKGRGLEYYASHVFDPGHSSVLAKTAADCFSAAIADDAHWEEEHPYAREHFSDAQYRIQAWLDRVGFDHSSNLDRWSLGDLDEERRYRGWCLERGLFLNPLNDALTLTVAAQDVLHLPSHTYTISEEARFPRYFNILKQEYVAARYRLFKSMESEEPDFVFKDVLLLDEGEDNLYGFYLEELKSAYRLAYGIFDKVALFLNEYFEVRLPPDSVSLRSIWAYKPKGERSFQLRSQFDGKRNWMLRGLYFVSKDILDPEFKDNAEPDAERLHDLRQQAEHRFLSLSDFRESDTVGGVHEIMRLDKFEERTLRLLGLAREAIIYLSLAMHGEESSRCKGQDDEPFLTMSVVSRPVKDFGRSR